MKIKVENINELKSLFCDHCYCVETWIKTDDELVKKTEYGAMFKDIMTRHLKCCNCGNNKKIYAQ